MNIFHCQVGVGRSLSRLKQMFRPIARSSVRVFSLCMVYFTYLNFQLNLLHASRPTLGGRPSLTTSRYLSQEARSTIEKAIKSKPVVLFMKGTPAEPQCGFSRAVAQVLDMQGVTAEKIQTYNVLADEELRTGIKEFSFVLSALPIFKNLTTLQNREWPTIPQVFVNGNFIGGCDILLSSEFAFLVDKVYYSQSTSASIRRTRNSAGRQRCHPKNRKCHTCGRRQIVIELLCMQRRLLKLIISYSVCSSKQCHGSSTPFRKIHDCQPSIHTGRS